MNKTMNRLMAVLLVIILICGVATISLTGIFTFKASAGNLQTGDIIEFGSYPQTRVTNADLIARLSLRLDQWQVGFGACKSYSYYSGTGNESDGKMKPSNYMLYQDVVDSLTGTKYRAVYFSSYRPYWTGFSSNPQNSFQDDNGYYSGNVYWFRFDPIKWRVLNASKGLLIADIILDAQPFNNTAYKKSGEYYTDSSCKYFTNDYAHSSLRQWLNDFWLDSAFSTNEEQKRILTTKLDNSAWDKDYTEYNADSTQDKVFLLSYDDSLNSEYGFSASTNADVSRQVNSSDYAKCQGLYTQGGGENELPGTFFWQLRTPGKDSSSSCGVDGSGKVEIICSTYCSDHGVRPAIRANLDSFRMTCSQVHTVSNYVEKNNRYEKYYLSGTSIALDGTGGNPDYCIPGLSVDDNYVPQGIAYCAAKNWIFVTAYNKDTPARPSQIFALDYNTGKFVAEFALQNSNGETMTGHVGGIAVSGNNIYLANGSSIYYIPLNSLNSFEKTATVVASYKLSGRMNGAYCSYVSITDDILWTGNFYEPTSSNYNTPAGKKEYNSVVLGFKLTGSGDRNEWDAFAGSEPYATYILPKSIENVQWATRVNGYLMLSASYGRKNHSNVFAVPTSMMSQNISPNTVYIERGMPMMEGAFCKDGSMYFICESGADYYNNNPDNRAVNPTDVVWKLNYSALVQAMKNAKERNEYSFGNWYGKDGFYGDDNTMEREMLSSEYRWLLFEDLSPIESILLFETMYPFKINEWFSNLFVEDDKKTDAGKWGGACAGMSYVSLLVEMGRLHPDYFQKGASGVYDFESPYYCNRIRDLIMYYQYSSYLTRNDSSSDESENLKKLISCVQSSSYPVCIGISIRKCEDDQDGGGHALLASNLTTIGDYYRLDIRDPNKSARFFFVRKDYSDSYFTDASQERYTYEFDDHKTLYTFFKTTETAEQAASTFDKKNFEQKLKWIDSLTVYASGEISQPMIDIQTNYQSFTVRRSDGKTATVQNGQIETNRIDLKYLGASNAYGSDLALNYSLPALEDGQTYSVVPDAGRCKNVISGEPIKVFKTMITDCLNGTSYSIWAEESVSAVIHSDGSADTASKNNAKQFVSFARNSATTDWYASSVCGETTGLSIQQKSNAISCSASSSSQLDMICFNSFNDLQFENLSVDANKPVIATTDDRGNTVLTDYANHILRSERFGHSVVFFSNGGTEVDAVCNLVKGSKIPEPDTPKREEYTFLGWYTSPKYENETQWNFATDTIQEDMQLYAKWSDGTEQTEKRIYSVSLADITVQYKQTITVQPNVICDNGANYTVTFLSGNNNIVTVDADGTIQTYKRGETSLTVIVTDDYGNVFTDTCKVSVYYKWWQWLIVIFLFGWIWYK